MINPLVSICVPIYGVEKYIERCAVSLLEQTYDNIEYIFVNDCTKDRSLEILTSVIERYSHRKTSIKIINHEFNRGLAAVRNTAIDACTGEFLMHVDSDDYVELDTVEKALKKQQEADDYDIVSFGCYREYSRKTVVQIPPFFKDGEDMSLKLIRKKINVGVWGRLYRTSLYKNNSIKTKEGVNMAEDYQVTPRLAYFAKKVAVIDKPFYHYNLANENSYVGSVSKEKVDQAWQSLLIISDFFMDKGVKYLDAVYTAKAHFIIRSLINIGKGDLGEPLFQKSHNALKTIPISYRKRVSFPYYILLKISDYRLLKLYLKLTSVLKSN